MSFEKKNELRIKVKVIETRSLGKDYPTAHYVENADFTDPEIIGNGLA